MALNTLLGEESVVITTFGRLNLCLPTWKPNRTSPNTHKSAGRSRTITRQRHSQLVNYHRWVILKYFSARLFCRCALEASPSAAAVTPNPPPPPSIPVIINSADMFVSGEVIKWLQWLFNSPVHSTHFLFLPASILYDDSLGCFNFISTDEKEWNLIWIKLWYKCQPLLNTV
jgi:hypothetical protein